MSNKSRFKDVFATIKQGDAEEIAEVQQDAPLTTNPERRTARVQGGKKNNPTYTQTTAYVRNEIYGEVRKAAVVPGHRPVRTRTTTCVSGGHDIRRAAQR